MTVKVIEGAGVTACPAGFSAPYEGVGYKRGRPGCRRVLIADEPVPDLKTYGFDATADSCPWDLGGFDTEAGRSWSHRFASTDAFKAELTPPAFA